MLRWWRRAEQPGDRQASDHQRAHGNHIGSICASSTSQLHCAALYALEAGLRLTITPPVIPEEQDEVSKN